MEFGRVDPHLHPDVYTSWVNKALGQETSSITGLRLPFAIDNDEIVAALTKAEAQFTSADVDV
jgi:hypothetical protein